MDFATSLSAPSSNMPTEIPLFENPDEEAFDGELGMEGDDFPDTSACTTPPNTSDTTMERAMERAAEKKKPAAVPSGYMSTKVVVDQVRGPRLSICMYRTADCFSECQDSSGQLSRSV
jgi:hypothetical protein